MNVFIGRENNAIHPAVTPKAQNIFAKREERLKSMFSGATLNITKLCETVPCFSETYVLKRKGLPDIDLRSYYEYFSLKDRTDVHTLIRILEEIEKITNH